MGGTDTRAPRRIDIDAAVLAIRLRGDQPDVQLRARATRPAPADSRCRHRAGRRSSARWSSSRTPIRWCARRPPRPDRTRSIRPRRAETRRPPITLWTVEPRVGVEQGDRLVLAADVGDRRQRGREADRRAGEPAGRQRHRVARIVRERVAARYFERGSARAPGAGTERAATPPASPDASRLSWHTVRAPLVARFACHRVERRRLVRLRAGRALRHEHARAHRADGRQDDRARRRRRPPRVRMGRHRAELQRLLRLGDDRRVARRGEAHASARSSRRSPTRRRGPTAASRTAIRR